MAVSCGNIVPEDRYTLAKAWQQPGTDRGTDRIQPCRRQNQPGSLQQCYSLGMSEHETKFLAALRAQFQDMPFSPMEALNDFQLS